MDEVFNQSFKDMYSGVIAWFVNLVSFIYRMAHCTLLQFHTLISFG